MTIETTYCQTREQLKSLMDRAVDDREIIMIKRRSEGDVALLAADELQYGVQTDRRTAKRLLDLMRDALRDPFVGIGKPEPLK